MNGTVKIAGVQMNPKMMASKENLSVILKKTGEAAANGAELIVFPECALSGYMYSSREEAMPFAETIPGKSTGEVVSLCKKLNVHVVFGLFERDGDKYFNAAAFVGPAGYIGKYRKVHLPFLGVDRFLDRGDQPFKVYQTKIGNIGMFICYDVNFCESARTMALMGADILVLPTNWPAGRGKVARYVIVTRAMENKVNFVAVNRVGVERGARFLGTSKIINALGDVLAQASEENEEIIYAEVKLADAREKRLIIQPGEFEMDFIHDRRPEFYGEVTKIRK